MTSTGEIVVIGSGAAGLSAAQTVAGARRPVTLIESHRLGGECTWNGCVPSKALIEAARLAHDMSRAGAFGLRVPETEVDFPAVMARVHRVVEGIARYEDAGHLADLGVTVRLGHARLLDAHTVDLDGERLPAESIIVCSGGAPAVPPIDGLREADPHTNETIFALEEQPRRLLILGAGPIGLELAQAFRRLGTEVCVVDVVDHLLPTEDPDIAGVALRVLTAAGIELRLNTHVQRVSRDGGTVTLHLPESEGDPITGDALLVATGRRPRTAGMGLEDLGVGITRKGITVDAHLRTAIPSVFAAGDVTGIMPFTHAAAYQGRLAAHNAMGKSRKADYRVVPWAVFIDPPVAHVGLTEPQAREKHGDDVRVASLPFTAVDRAVIDGSAEGLIKVIVRSKPVIGHAVGGEIIGAHAIGPGAADLIHEFAIAMKTHAFAGRLAQTIHAYPTLAMGVQQVVSRLFAQGRATAGSMREDLLHLDP